MEIRDPIFLWDTLDTWMDMLRDAGNGWGKTDGKQPYFQESKIIECIMDDFDDADDGLKTVCHSNWTIFSRHPNLDGWVIDKDGWFRGSNHLVVVETWRESFSMIVFKICTKPDSTPKPNHIIQVIIA